MNNRTNLIRPITEPALITLLLLSVPFIASYYTDEVLWSTGDYLLAGILLFGTGLTYKLVTNHSSGTAYKVAFGFALLSGLFLIWANLAVGIIGSEDNYFNLIYYGIPLVGIIGAFTVRFSAVGLAKTMITLSILLVIVTVIAIISGMYRVTGSSIIEVLGVNSLFIFLFSISALLFRYAAQQEATSSENES